MSLKEELKKTISNEYPKTLEWVLNKCQLEEMTFYVILENYSDYIKDLMLNEKILELTAGKMSAEYISKNLGCSKYYVYKVRGSRVYEPYENENDRREKFPKELLDEWEKVTAKLRRCFK